MIFFKSKIIYPIIIMEDIKFIYCSICKRDYMDIFYYAHKKRHSYLYFQKYR